MVLAKLASFGGPRSKERLGVLMCAYAHRYGLVYIYIYIYKYSDRRVRELRRFRKLRVTRRPAHIYVHGMRTGAD